MTVRLILNFKDFYQLDSQADGNFQRFLANLQSGCSNFLRFLATWQSGREKSKSQTFKNVQRFLVT